MKFNNIPGFLPSIIISPLEEEYYAKINNIIRMIDIVAILRHDFLSNMFHDCKLSYSDKNILITRTQDRVDDLSIYKVKLNNGILLKTTVFHVEKYSYQPQPNAINKLVRGNWIDHLRKISSQDKPVIKERNRVDWVDL